MENEIAPQNHSLKEIATLFLTLGFTAFGGPAAHIAMMQHEVVNRKKWMTEEHFLDLIGATNLIPGPNSTEMAIHIGYERGGWKGLLIAGLCFILPAVFITGVFAWFYKQYGALPQAQSFIYGIKPAIIAVILAAVFPLAKKSLKSVELVVIGAIVLVFCLFGYNEILVMFGAGLFGLLLQRIKTQKLSNTFFPLPLLQLVPVSNLKLFLIFLKIGSILYGSGYVLFAFLDDALVTTGYLARQQLIDAIAVGQFTPGPVFSSVTFIGYQMNGIVGAVVATIGIFLPSFLLVILLKPLIPKMRKSTWFSHFLDAVNVASVAIILAVCYQMAVDSIYDWRTIVIGMLSLAVTVVLPKLNSAWIVLGSALLGYLLLLL